MRDRPSEGWLNVEWEIALESGLWEQQVLRPGMGITLAVGWGNYRKSRVALEEQMRQRVGKNREKGRGC